MPGFRIKNKNKLKMKDYNRPTYRYSIQIGIFRNYDHALELQLYFINNHFPTEILHKGECFSVLIGDFDFLDEAVLLEWYLRKKGYDTLLVAV
jgi:hypothetical protein